MPGIPRPLTLRFPLPAAAPRAADLLALAALLGIAGAATAGDETPEDPAPPIVLTEAAAAAGLDFVHSTGRSGKLYYPESMGGGVCLFDADGDGWTDVYFVNGGPLPPTRTPTPTPTPMPTPTRDAVGGAAAASRPANALFRNNRDGTFTSDGARAGVADASYGTGACAADFDNDGDTDLYVLNFGDNVLYTNQGDGTFADTTAAAGVAGGGWSVAGAFFDYDRDGRLDIFVARYLDYSCARHQPCRRATTRGEITDYCGPTTYEGLEDILYRNLGGGRFADVSRQVGLRGNKGRGMGVSVSDFDADGWPDVFVANDQMRNYLYRNHEGKRFSDEALLAGVAFDDGGNVQASMGVAWGDYDNDGRLDLFVPCLRREVFPLYRNEGDGFFSDVARRTGLALATLPFTGFGAILADLDNDGWLDAFTSNGAVFAHEGARPAEDPFTEAYGERALLLWNDAGKRFRDVSGAASPYFGELHVGRGAACGDLFNDGRLAVVINQSDERAALLRNETPRAAHHWLTVKTVGRRSNRDGIGARLTLRAGALTLTREVTAGGSVFSQNDVRPHFGLGRADRADALEIVWPSGISQKLTDLEVDRVLVLTEPES
jgi:hypothetical protein